jgi:ferredoxin
MVALLHSLEPLVATLRADGYTVVGPCERDGAIVLDVIDSASRLPSGWGVQTGPGTYRLHRRADRAAFAHGAGPQAWKRFLHPPRERVCSVDRPADGGLAFSEPEDVPPRYAFLGVRPCDLRAIAVQDRVLSASTRYAARRRAAFIVAVDCTEPSATCFCVSAGGGPDARVLGIDFDLVLTELAQPGDAEPQYIADAGSPAGARILAVLPQAPAPPDVVAAARHAVAAAADRMGRSLPDVDLRRMLAQALDSPHWDDVAARCLACANCTMACPTCFCTSVTDTTELRPPEAAGDHAERWQRWASCFELDFSYLHGGPVRTSAGSRYRQWLTHKLGTWHDQFGESGCVGCGRCIAWCPAGIDLTAEVRALTEEATRA